MGWGLPGHTQRTGWFKSDDSTSEAESSQAGQSDEYPVPHGATVLSGHNETVDAEQGPYFSNPEDEPSQDEPGVDTEDQETVLQRMGHGIRNMFTPYRPATGLRKTITRPFRVVSQRAMELPLETGKAIPLPIAAPKGVAAMGGKVIGWPAPRSWANPVVVDSPQTPELIRSAGNDETQILLSNGRSSANGPVMSVPLWHGAKAE